MTTFKDIQNSIIAPLFPLIFSDCNSDKKFIAMMNLQFLFIFY